MTSRQSAAIELEKARDGYRVAARVGRATPAQSRRIKTAVAAYDTASGQIPQQRRSS